MKVYFLEEKKSSLLNFTINSRAKNHFLWVYFDLDIWKVCSISTSINWLEKGTSVRSFKKEKRITIEWIDKQNKSIMKNKDYEKIKKSLILSLHFYYESVVCLWLRCRLSSGHCFADEFARSLFRSIHRGEFCAFSHPYRPFGLSNKSHF